jgi:hypothetical protein
MEVKTEKDALHMRKYRRRKREDKATREDFMAFVAERDLELFLEFKAKRAMESPPSEQDCHEEPVAAQYVLDFDTSLLE